MATPLKIRAFRPEDEAAVIALWKACSLAVAHNDPRKDIRRKLKVNAEWFLVGEKAGNIVASCMAGYEGHRGWINYLAVAPGQQRQGYASAVMSAAEELLRSAGCPKINLQVRSGNAAAMAFYESIGFVRDDVVSMGKRLIADST